MDSSTKMNSGQTLIYFHSEKTKRWAAGEAGTGWLSVYGYLREQVNHDDA
jgi:hypothetical protein